MTLAIKWNRGPVFYVGKWVAEFGLRYRWNKGKRKFFQYRYYPPCYEEPWAERIVYVGPVSFWWARF